jgi:hypothetical protein
LELVVLGSGGMLAQTVFREVTQFLRLSHLLAAVLVVVAQVVVD